MSDDESATDDERATHLDSLLVEKSTKIVVLHPGLTTSQFVEQIQLGYLPPNLQSTIKEIPLHDHNSEIIVRLWNEINDFVPATFDDLVALYRVCCGLMLLPCSIELTHLKLGVIHKIFRQTSREWEVCPVRIHMISKELYPLLKDSRNLMYFIRIIAAVSQMAFYVSCCLAFCLFFSIVHKEVKMYRLHGIQTVIDAVKDLDLQRIKDDPNEFYSLLDAIVFLINVIIFRNEEMICERYNEFFVSTREQINELLHWSEMAQRVFEPRNNVESQDSIMRHLTFYRNIAQYSKMLYREGADIIIFFYITELIDYDIIQRLREVLGESDSNISI